MLLDLFICREGVHGIKYQGKHIHFFLQEQESNHIWIAEEMLHWIVLNLFIRALFLTIETQNSLILSLKFTLMLQIQVSI